MARYLIHLAFDGTMYCGWQSQKKGVAVQDVLNQTVSKIFDESIVVVGCGRTDSGVHARDYYAHFDTSKNVPERLAFKLNNMSPEDILIKEVWSVPETFNARFKATSRQYTYDLHLQKDPFIRRFSTEFRFRNYDWDLIQQASEKLLCYTDFKPLSKFNPDNKTTLCTLTKATWSQTGSYQFRFTIAANRFLHNMVRRIVGTLLGIGAGKISMEEFEHVMNNTSEFKHVLKAPPQGLALDWIEYPDLIHIIKPI